MKSCDKRSCHGIKLENTWGNYHDKRLQKVCHGKPRIRMKKCTMREREMRVFMVTNQLKALAVDCFTISSTRAAWRNIKNTPAESKLSLGCSLYC